MGVSEIRSATGEDAEAIAAIYGHYVRATTSNFEFYPPEPAEIVRRMEEVRRNNLPYLVAVQNGQVIGYAYASHFRPRPAYRFAVEHSLYVDKDWVGRGTGGQLLMALMDSCREVGVTQMIAGVGGENPASVALHGAHGFQVVGVLRNVAFKFDRWLDLTLMQRPL